MFGWLLDHIFVIGALVLATAVFILCRKQIAQAFSPAKPGPFSPDWGNLPVLKVTGEREGRFVESRRLPKGFAPDKFETRLIVEGEIVETRRFKEVASTIQYHDSLCARNGTHPEKGAAPEWHSMANPLQADRQLESGNGSHTRHRIGR